MRRSICATAAILAMVGAPVAAQENVEPSDAIVVGATAPRQMPVERGDPRQVRPQMQLVSQVTVETDDLDLSTQAGQDTLEERVDEAAELACDWLDEVYPPVSVSVQQDCKRKAVHDAQDQVRTAIILAGR